MLKSLAAVLLGGLTAGALDIAYAIAVYGVGGVSPVTTLQSVATGVLGVAAYDGGLGTAAFGAALHFAIAVATAAGFVVLSRIVPVLLRRPIPAGIIYGLFLFVATMYLVGAPLSAPFLSVPSGWMLVGALFAHTALVGVPIALIAARLLAQGRRPQW